MTKTNIFKRKIMINFGPFCEKSSNFFKKRSFLTKICKKRLVLEKKIENSKKFWKIFQNSLTEYLLERFGGQRIRAFLAILSGFRSLLFLRHF